ncbi:transcription factor Adf-1-like [Bactrocera tryoni]|uniref:transcription factor Adf-1-like n=1 Tax=Bactrocera tryoni TaxID=59916 RepID=UPI001A97876E|nr:transcription factor Adf-1-like [Bactrocera tryoni]
MEEKLIEFGSENRFLYDKSHRNYKNSYLRDAKFQELSQKLNIPGEKLKDRWRTLRDKFYKDLKKKPSGSGVYSPHKKWKWMESLKFLKDVEMDNLNT